MQHTARIGMIFLILTILPLSVVVGQTDDTMESNLLSGGFIIALPSDWDVEEIEDGVFRCSNDDVILQIYAPKVVSSTVDVDDEVDPVDLLVAFFDDPMEPEIDREQIWLGEPDQQMVAGWPFEPATWNRQTEGVRIIFTMGSGDYAALEARVTASEYDTYERLITEIAASFDNIGKRLTLSPITNTGEPCTLSTHREDASVRVGPGRHRGVLTYLPVGLEFMVQGQANADDDSLWWKLDPNDVAPGSGANEVWVSDGAVTVAGDCAAVVEAVAPPIIFGPASLPEGVESPSASDPSVVTEGIWLVDIGNPLPCGNRIYEYQRASPAPYSAYIMVTDTFIFGDIGFYFINANGDYVGSTILSIDGEDTAASVVLTVESETLILGVISFTRDGCEWPHLATITKQ